MVYNLASFVMITQVTKVPILRFLHSSRRLRTLAFSSLLLLNPPAKAQVLLPDLGDASRGLVSHQQEKQLGEMWLRSFRSQVRTSSDPLINEYFEKLLNKLAAYSELQDKNLQLVVVPNDTINAFAVPGGVIGVHTGLLLNAENEDQLASVLAHELAHLSQRHYARSIEKQANSQLPFMAAMLASLVIAAAGGGDAGLAALSATQAAAIDSQLRFSRKNEQEADRIGMQTMVNAGMDPHAFAGMFEKMLQLTRFSRRYPEFLLTHPVTESRIADSKNRARRYPKPQHEQGLMFYLMQARVKVANEDTPTVAAQRFRSELQGLSFSEDASRYGLALALTKGRQLDEAREALQPLLDKDPINTVYQLASIDIEAKAGHFDKALDMLRKQLSNNPNSYPLSTRFAELLMESGNYVQAEGVLENMTKARPEDDYLWYLLAEVHGLAGNILGVHKARAEYFVLNGIYDKAVHQLENALHYTRGDTRETAIIQERIKSIRELQKNSKL